MILILIWHSMFPWWNLMFGYVFSFHVALFFFLSWYLFNDIKHNNFWIFFKDKAKRLIIPYFFFNLIFYVYIDIIKTEHHDFYSVLRWTLYWSWLRWNDEIFLLNVSTWFLLALFFTSIFYFVLNKLTKNKLLKLVFLITISIWIHYESIHFREIRLPFSLEPSLMAMLFYWVWHLYKEKISFFVEKIKLIDLLILPVLIYANIYFMSWTNFSTNEYWDNYFRFILSSILGILTWIIIAKNIPKNWILDFLWKNSIIILWMEFLKTRILGWIAMFSFWYVIYERSYLSGTVQVIWTIIALIPIIFFINFFTPFVIWGWWKRKK
jgi:fucose 4-O-acetylase-like acetyltransferase